MIEVLLCCNDARGNFLSRVHRIEMRDHRDFWIEVEGPEIACVLREPDWVGIGRRRFVKSGHSPWVGNVFWDGVSMTQAEGLRLLRYLLERGWESTGGSIDGPFDAAEARFKAESRAPSTTEGGR